MENVLACILIVAISFSVSFYLARACLIAIIRLIGGPSLLAGWKSMCSVKLLRQRKTMAIQQAEEKTKCAHPACQCIVATGEQYCS